MKILPIIAATIVSVASPAKAENFTLSKHGFWTVVLSTEQTYSMCAMINDNRGAVFGINAMSDGTWGWAVQDDVPSQPRDEWIDVQFDIRIGRNTQEWSMTDAGIEADQLGGWLEFDFSDNRNAREFIRDIARGTDVRLVDPWDGRMLYGWSLRGSAAAAQDLYECARRIQ